jgi:hypothetical protein
MERIIVLSQFGNAFDHAHKVRNDGSRRHLGARIAGGGSKRWQDTAETRAASDPAGREPETYRGVSMLIAM